MWRRWNQPQEPTIGQPMLFETTMDERYLETIPEVESLRSTRSSVATALPDLPFRAVPPLNDLHPALRESKVSSIYSQEQDSPTLPRDDLRDLTPSPNPGADDISPVSTPRSSIDFAASDTSIVSPIESTFTIPPRPPPQEQPKSHIPRPLSLEKKEMPQAETPQSARDKKQNTRWNKYTGEQTTEETGLPAQAPKPGTQQSLEMQFPQLKERTKQILAGLRERDSTKKTPWGKTPPPVAADPLDNPVQKVPWKGASGRTTLVDPVQNTPAARKGPIHFPQRNVSKMNPAQDQARTMSPETVHAGPAPAPAPLRSSPDEEPLQSIYQTVTQAEPLPPSPLLAEHIIRAVESQESIKPIAPLKVKSPRVTSPVEAQNIASLKSPFHSPHPSQATVPENGHSVPRLKDSPKPKYTLERSSPPETPEARMPRKAVAESKQNLGTSHLQHEPDSRFSWTTYATTVNDSPHSMAPAQMSSSPVPPMPPISDSIMLRKRPVSTTQTVLPYSDISANHSRASLVSRKPIATDKYRSASTISESASKSLPPTPIELEAGDKISSLEARMEDLRRRKRNNSKINQELTDSLKRNAVNYDMKKRKEVEKMIANLSLELDEITREEHEVGLNHHRAQKKRDREDCYENPTGLWIKRVTS